MTAPTDHRPGSLATIVGPEEVAIPPAVGAGATDAGSAGDRPRALQSSTLDGALSCVGAGLGSFALAFVIYRELLPLAGVVGFAVLWYVLFLLLYAGVTALEHPRAVVVDRVVAAVLTLAASVVLAAVAWVVLYTVTNGYKPLGHLNFFTQDSSRVGPTTSLRVGGIEHAIVGSAVQLGIAVAIALPLGLLTAIFMTEVGGVFTRVVRTVVEAMTAVPDLLAGLFVYTVFILYLHMEKDGLAAALAIAVTMTPIIARTSEVSLRIVPGSLREAGLALGASQWQTVRRVVLPFARPGLATALILAVARGIGESAPLLIVSGASAYYQVSPLRNAQNALPLYIIDGARRGQPLLTERAFGAATVLLAVVFVLFLGARLLSRQRVGRT